MPLNSLGSKKARNPSSNLGGTFLSARGAVVALAPPEGMDGGSNPPEHSLITV